MTLQARSKLRIYHVEDHSLLRESMHALLSLEPDVELVGSAPDAELALRQLEFLDVDVVLMDIHLPGMDGIEATRLLSEKHPGLPVVMLTSHGDELMGAALEAGALGYIDKSCSLKQLVGIVRDALNARNRSPSSMAN